MKAPTTRNQLTIRQYTALLLIIAAGVADFLCLLAAALSVLGVHSALDHLVSDWSEIPLFISGMVGFWCLSHLARSLILWAWKD
ncbi:hypothetical protein G5S35_39150 [Paraburkholderia tropica]|uniref:hypothetical protein n=1 Tax=Paraburkholderia tropica TaxID=92647 RepID=UPI0015FEE6F9|nr:hypothetical protein [Paraburkholderia tropica]QNB17584.1 hypothetical protein G5S35_39150 [Paraburkholderia tropica]